jgi:hypothetical protein
MWNARSSYLQKLEPRTCKRIQIPAQKPATGQAIKMRRMSQMMAKRGFFAMVAEDEIAK